MNKIYRHKTYYPGVDFELVGKTNSGENILVYKGHPVSLADHQLSEHYVEYKEPVKYVWYFNTYKSGLGASPFISRKEADILAGHDRIGCIRVEFTEGQFDD